MSEEYEKEILNELKSMNEKLDKLNEQSPQTTPILIRCCWLFNIGTIFSRWSPVYIAD